MVHADSQSAASLATIDPSWAWSPYEPSAEAPWDLRRAAHLFRRAGFGADWARLQRALEQGPEQTVADLLAGGPDQEAFSAEMSRSARAAIASGNVDNVSAWWLYVMRHTPHPLREKLALFWHDHFATSAEKVSNPRLMLAHVELLREHALGPFEPMLAAISRDPAMLLWLDSATNRRSHPNENFARELFELFALGLGHYTEEDIREAARAFTGWEVRREQFLFNAGEHDTGEKTVFGRTGRFDGDDVVRLVLEQPTAAPFLAAKLVRFFISEMEEPPPELLAPLADQYRQSGYDTAAVVAAILRSNLFYSSASLGQRVKSPVEFALGLLTALEGTTNFFALHASLRELGQALLYPPNVAGWDGGTAWINTSTLLARANLVLALVNGDGEFPRLDLERLVERHGWADGDEQVGRLLELLVAMPVPDGVRSELADLARRRADQGAPRADQLARVVRAIGTLPEFQLC